MSADLEIARARQIAEAAPAAAGPEEGAAGAAAPAADGGNGSPLTPREREVLALVAAGLSNQAIGERLFVSEHTVHRHVANILTKLDVPSRAAAAARATREKLI
jgi:DNA-binding NarL/FixJ family response regulator